MHEKCNKIEQIVNVPFAHLHYTGVLFGDDGSGEGAAITLNFYARICHNFCNLSVWWKGSPAVV